MELAEEIKKIRISAMLSQQEFGAALGRSEITVCRWETGTSVPSLPAMQKMKVFCKKHKYDFTAAETAWKEYQIGDK